MKSRKFKAVLAAVSAIAVLATAMTGFADVTVNTTTQYNLTNNKVAVETRVTGVADGTQVTYLVKTVDGAGVDGSEIAYIDQKAASDGATFTWQIDRDVLSDATVANLVTVGNDEGLGVGTGGLGVKALTAPTGTGYTVTYDADYAGTETITAVIEAADDYEITSIKIDGVEQNLNQRSYDVAVVNGDPVAIAVEAKEAEKELGVVDGSAYTPAVQSPTTGEHAGKHIHGKIFKVQGFDSTKHEAGVKHTIDGVEYEFPAVYGLNQDYIIVELVTDDGTTIEATPYVKEVTANN